MGSPNCEDTRHVFTKLTNETSVTDFDRTGPALTWSTRHT